MLRVQSPTLAHQSWSSGTHDSHGYWKFIIFHYWIRSKWSTLWRRNCISMRSMAINNCLVLSNDTKEATHSWWFMFRLGHWKRAKCHRIRPILAHANLSNWVRLLHNEHQPQSHASNAPHRCLLCILVTGQCTAPDAASFITQFSSNN